MIHFCYSNSQGKESVENIQLNFKLEPWASKLARHYFEGLDMQRNE